MSSLESVPDLEPASLWVAACAKSHRFDPRSAGGSTTRLELRATGAVAPRQAVVDGCRVLFAGVLDNIDELRRRTGAIDDPDAATIAVAYREVGDSVLETLRGRFALLIEDQRRDEVLVVRDPMGMSPLFYTDCGDEVLVSSGLDDLVRHPGVNADMNRAALADHLCNRWPDPEETFYSHVKRVPPGWVLRLGRGVPIASRYWNLPFAWADVQWLSEPELERFDAVLEQAVDRCCGVQMAGIYLSGGIDSVSIAAFSADLARRAGRKSPVALSLAFPDPDVSEVEVQQAVAARLGLPQVMAGFEETVGPSGLFQAGLELSRRTPAPLMNFWLPAYRQLGLQGIQRGCRVLLTGEGGDEWLTVTPLLAADLIRKGQLGALWRLLAETRRSYHLSTAATTSALLWKFGMRPLVAGGMRSLLEVSAPWLLRRRWKRQIAQATPGWIAPDPQLRAEVLSRAENARSRPLASEHYLAELLTALDHPLVSMDREEAFDNGRRLGAPILSPYLDADLVELLFATPPDLLSRGGRAKGLARARLARRFPDLGFERQKKLTATAFATRMFVAQATTMLRAKRPFEVLEELGIVDSRRFADELRRTIAEPSRHADAFSAWYGFSTESWLRAHA